MFERVALSEQRDYRAEYPCRFIPAPPSPSLPLSLLTPLFISSLDQTLLQQQRILRVR
jgi:hypothetical protein